MKCNKICEQILINCGTMKLSEDAKLILSRFNIDNKSKFQIDYATKHGCLIKLTDNKITYSFFVRSDIYAFSFEDPKDMKIKSVTNCNKNQMLNFLNKNKLMNDIRQSMIENLEESEYDTTDITNNLNKIFDVLRDDFFDQMGVYHIHSDQYSSVVECYFNGMMLKVQSNGNYGLYQSYNPLDFVKEHKGRCMKFKEFLGVLEKRNLIKKKECKYKDAELYILDFE